MSEEKALSERLLEALGDLVPEEEKERLKRKAEKVAQDSMKGLEQLKEDAAKLVEGAKKTADDAMKSFEEAFINFQTNVDQMNERRRVQAEQVHSRLAFVLEKLRESNVGQQLRNKLEKKAQTIMEAIRTSEEQLTKDILDELEELSRSVDDIADKGSKELKKAMADVVEAVTNTDKTNQRTK